MLLYAEWLTAFVERHRDEILMLANGSREPASLLTATKRLIVQRGSLHMAGELKDQKREIENELWYRGEEGTGNRSGIQLEWTARHAVEWPRWRIKEHLFVAAAAPARSPHYLARPRRVALIRPRADATSGPSNCRTSARYADAPAGRALGDTGAIPALEKFGLAIGLVESGPLVRSSYHADEQSQNSSDLRTMNFANALTVA